jgi:hypothetical protein
MRIYTSFTRDEIQMFGATAAMSGQPSGVNPYCSPVEGETEQEMAARLEVSDTWQTGYETMAAEMLNAVPPMAPGHLFCPRCGAENPDIDFVSVKKAIYFQTATIDEAGDIQGDESKPEDVEYDEMDDPENHPSSIRCHACGDELNPDDARPLIRAMMAKQGEYRRAERERIAALDLANERHDYYVDDLGNVKTGEELGVADRKRPTYTWQGETCWTYFGHWPNCQKGTVPFINLQQETQLASCKRMDEQKVYKRLLEARSDLVPELKAEFKGATFVLDKRMLRSVKGNVLVILPGMNGATFLTKSEYEESK